MWNKLKLAARVLTIVLAIVLTVMLMTPGRGSQGSCIMPTSGTVTGLTLVNDINACNGALLSLYSGAAPPGGATTGMLWLNTSTSVVQQYDGTAWNNLWLVDATNHLSTIPIGGGSISATIASATTTDIGSILQSYVSVTGTTTITSLGSSAVTGTIHVLQFSGSLLLTYNATSLILPGGISITTQPGDIALAMYLGGGNWRVLNYSAISGAAVTSSAVPLGTVIMGDFMTLPPKTVYGSGQAISRSSFPGYLAAVTRTQTMTRSNGNATLTAVADTSMFGAGMPVEGPGISAGCTIASLVLNTSITLNNSSCVTASGSASITVFGTGYGAGGDSTTVGVKDCKGRVIAGRDDMFNGAASRLTSTTMTPNGNALNAKPTVESQTHALTTPESPPYTPAGTIAVAGNTPISQALTTASFGTGGNVAYTTSGASSTPLLTLTVTSQTFTGTPGGGTSAAFSIVQPAVIANCVVVVSP